MRADARLLLLLYGFLFVLLAADLAATPWTRRQEARARVCRRLERVDALRPGHRVVEKVERLLDRLEERGSRGVVR